MKIISFSLMISVLLLLCSCGAATVTDGAYIFNSEIIKSGDTVLDNNLKITDGGVFTLSGTGENAQVTIDTKADVTLVFDNLSITSSKPVINVVSAKSVTISLPDSSKSTLSVESTGDDEIAIIDSKSDLIFEGNGLLTIKSSRDDAIVCEKNISVSGGTYNIDVGHNGIESEGAITFDGGDFNIKSGNDAIKAENDTPELAKITFNGGSFNISAVDDGASTSGDMVVNNANINITTCEEGLEGKTVLIENGNINIVATDDGINARGIEIAEERYEGADFTINGGNLSIDASGDGIDSNGNLNLNGGQIFVSGAADGGNSAIDYDYTSTLDKATVIATGYSGMFRGINKSANPTINVYLEEAVADAITLSDSNGNIIVSFAPNKNYNHIFISSPGIKLDNSYTIKYGEAVLDITISDNNTIIGSSGGFGGPGGFGGFGGRVPNGEMPNFDPDNMPEFGGEIGDENGGGNPQRPNFPNGERPSGEGFPEGARPEGNFGGNFPEGARPEGNFGGITPPQANTVKTYEKTDSADIVKNMDTSQMIVINTYHKLSDGSYSCCGYNYKYRIEVSGRLNNAKHDSNYVILSNTENITFDEAWKASGLSSNTNDYFKPENAIIVERSGL